MDSKDHPFSLQTSICSIPSKFIWPKLDQENVENLDEPTIDLQGFFNGDNEHTKNIVSLVRSACMSHGLFQVINHGIDSTLIKSMHDVAKAFFELPMDQKMKVQRVDGSLWGYSFAHENRFSLNLPWKETISCLFNQNCPDFEDAAFFESAVGERRIFLKYCEAMKNLSLTIMEILAISLGVDQSYFKDFFEDGNSIMRCNLYPPCREPQLTLGTGPHCDPPALTILHQDQVGGLQVFHDYKWKTVKPRHDALVVNLGDIFAVLSNGLFKSCQHRAVVNKRMERVSLVFFLCPKEDKVISAPQGLIGPDRPKMYPNFTWSDFLNFTQKHYRVDVATLQNFVKWFISHQTT